MSDPTITDLRRELEKARYALIDAQSHLASHAEMNAALHCSTAVLYSPLHAKVTAAIQGIEHALLRTESAVTGSAPDPAHTDANCPWREILTDLDRCEHGRHEGDECYGCAGLLSPGNPHMQPGDVIGYDVHADPIVMPDRDAKHDPKAWRGTSTEEHQ